MMKKTSQTGNVLVIILAATGLFGLLSYMLLRSGGSANQQVVAQKDIDLGIYEMLRYGAAIEDAIYQMVAMNNIGDTQISFEADADPNSANYVNGNCSNNSCRIFEIAGGGIEWREPPESVRAGPSTQYIFSGASAIYGHGTDGFTAGNGDLFMSVPVTLAACEAAGAILETDFSDASGPTDSFLNPPFTGAYSSTSGEVIDHADLAGEKAFCFENTTDSNYYFTYVLYAR